MHRLRNLLNHIKGGAFPGKIPRPFCEVDYENCCSHLDLISFRSLENTLMLQDISVLMLHVLHISKRKTLLFPTVKN